MRTHQRRMSLPATGDPRRDPGVGTSASGPVMTATPARTSGRLPGVVAALLVLGAALLILGSSLERADDEAARPPIPTESAQHDESTERAESARGEEAHHDGSSVAASQESPLFELLESPVSIAGFGLVSLGLAAAVWRRPTRPVLAVVLLFAAAAAVLDTVEIGIQLSADRTGLAVLAGVIVVTRIAVIGGAIQLWRTRTRTALGAAPGNAA